MDILKFKEFIKSDPDLKSYLSALSIYLDKTDFNKTINREMLLNDHRLMHIIYNRIESGEKLLNQQGPLIGKEISLEQVIAEHKIFVLTMKRIGIHHNSSGGVDDTLPKSIKEFSIQDNPEAANKLVDLLNKLREQEKALTTETGAALIPEKVAGDKVDKPKIKSNKPEWIKYIAYPYSNYIYLGLKTLVLSSVNFKKHLNEPIYIADKKFIYGVYELGEPFEIKDKEQFIETQDQHKITNQDLIKWWNSKYPLYAYPLKLVRKFQFPIPYKYPKGFQNWISSDKIVKDRVVTTEGVDFSMIDLLELYPESISKLSNSKIEAYHEKLHNLFNDEHRIKINSPSNETLYHIHLWLLDEMLKRKIEHIKMSGNLDELTMTDVSETKGLREDTLATVNQLNDISIIPHYISIVGSLPNENRDPNDIDLLVRSDYPDSNLVLKVERVLEENGLKEKPHWIWSSKGPHSSYLPIFDLVVKKSILKRVKVDESRYKESTQADAEFNYFQGLDKWKPDFISDAIHIVENVSGKTVLDVACGTGRVMDMLKCGGYDVKGIDNNELAVSFAKSKGLDVSLGDCSKGLPYKDNEFDTCIAIHALEHFDDPIALLNEMARVSHSIVCIVPLGKRQDSTHKQVFDANSVIDMVEQTDLVGIAELIDNNNMALYLDRKSDITKSMEPFKKFSPQKPAMALYTDFFSTDELWDKWAKDMIASGKHVEIETKLNGFRTIISKKNNKVEIIFENKNRTKELPELVSFLKTIDSDFIMDGDLGIETDGKRWARIDLMTLMSDNPSIPKGSRLIYTAFDLPYWNEDFSDKPFKLRRDLLERFHQKNLRNEQFGITTYNPISNKEELDTKSKDLASEYMSEGIVAKVIESPYEQGGTNNLAKVKKIAEFKVIVLDKQTNKNGTFSYTSGVINDGEYTNVKKLNDIEYVNLGNTMSTNVDANIGDILTVTAEEIIEKIDKKVKELFWVIPRITDKDNERKEPYYSGQVIDLAKRKKIYQYRITSEEIEKSLKEDEPNRQSLSINFWKKNWQDMYPKSGSGKFVLQQHWRGLSEDESKLSQPELLNTENSVHGDLRFLTKPGLLFGWSIFYGTTQDVKNDNGDRVINIGDNKLQSQPKLAQPEIWIHMKDGTVFNPGEPGSTTQKYSKFFILDSGNYKIGVWREHFIELFLMGDKAKGRYILSYAPIEGKRIWLLSNRTTRDHTL